MPNDDTVGLARGRGSELPTSNAEELRIEDDGADTLESTNDDPLESIAAGAVLEPTDPGQKGGHDSVAPRNDCSASRRRPTTDDTILVGELETIIGA